mmetsp:Transcript_18182/g.34610  ORF Transcript_18182/g.34610 Transcript_18182/m.34610 type:complete len:430 (+) Transcript_18182:266-1555(+)
MNASYIQTIRMIVLFMGLCTVESAREVDTSANGRRMSRRELIQNSTSSESNTTTMSPTLFPTGTISQENDVGNASDVLEIDVAAPRPRYQYTPSNISEEPIDWSIVARPIERLNLAGRQRMYSQKLAKDAMLIYLEVNMEEALWSLQDTKAKFMYVHNSHKIGNLYSGIKPTTETHMIAQLESIDEVLHPFNQALDAIIKKGYANSSEIDVVVANELTLLQRLNAFVGMVELMNSQQTDEDGNTIEAADEVGLTRAEVLINAAINQAGAQRMRTQKMVFQYCKLLAGFEVDAARTSLLDTVAMFDRVHVGLYKGDEELNLPGIADPELLHWLNRINVHWARKNGVRFLLTEDPSEHRLLEILKYNLMLLGRYNVVVGLINIDRSISMPPPPPSPPPLPSGSLAHGTTGHATAVMVSAAVAFSHLSQIRW